MDEEHFPATLDPSYTSVIKADPYGETIDLLHGRLAYALAQVIAACDAEPNGPRAILICTHAACMIAMGRVLTGVMPEDFADDDFQCYTASCSVYRRRGRGRVGGGEKKWDAEKPGEVSEVRWKGVGIAGGWECERNADCSYLSGGEERGWKFHGDESFLVDPNSFNDAVLEQTERGKGSRL